jgi:hypothetical protein|tara:strand:+ start:2362 stop:3183 length:822 start_codon:yes stop_codon:yes gene_type:complete
MDMLPKVGPIIGYGQAGFVFDVEGSPDKVIKIVQIRPLVDGMVLPYRNTFKDLRTMRSRKIATNELQANLMARLVGQPVSENLPQIYDFGIGEVDSDMRNELRLSYQKYGWKKNDLLSALKEFQQNNRVAWWVMEKIPNTIYNNWGGMMEHPHRAGWNPHIYENQVPEEQEAYRNLTADLFKYANVIIRDVANVANMGFREDGTPVWFDPIVSTWPINPNMENSTSLLDREKYDLFVAAFDESQMKRYEQALSNNQYFNFRHGVGALMAEGSE